MKDFRQLAQVAGADPTVVTGELRFDQFVLDLKRSCLRAPKGDLRLRPKSFEVLRYLLEHAGSVVSKDELLAAVWPKVTVTEDSLTRCVSEIRQALGSAGEQIVKTVPRRGYLLDAPVSPGAAPKNTDERTIAGQNPDEPFLAVLPFVNLSSEVDQEYFCDALTEDLITELSRFTDLRVIARHSVFQYKGKAIDMRQVGRELGVRYVLEGSVRRTTERIRVSAQLADASNGTERWAERYDCALEDVFTIQDQIARSIASLLIAHVRRAESERLLLKPPAYWQAYDNLIRGLSLHLAYQSSQDLGSLHEARRCFQRAIALDPAYARAYSALAISYLASWSNFGDGGFLQTSVLTEAYQCALQAVQIDPQLPDAQMTFAWVLTWRREHDAALRALERVVQIHPNYLHWQLAGTFMFAGELDTALRSMIAYMRVDPFHPTSASGWLGVTHFALGNLNDAYTLLKQAAAQSPKRAMFRYWLAATVGHRGNVAEARAEAESLLLLQPEFRITTVAGPLSVFRPEMVTERFLEGLQRCGLPD